MIFSHWEWTSHSIFCSSKKPTWFVHRFYYKVGLHTNPPLPSDAVWYYIHNHGQLDVLKQKERENGPLWSDKEVYHTAEDIQLLYPQKFSNIFLGIGGFHLEKIVIACLDRYLELSGIHCLTVRCCQLCKCEASPRRKNSVKWR